MKRVASSTTYITPLHFLVVLLMFEAILCITPTAFARPRVPLPPYPEMELTSWRFDDPYAMDAASLHAITASNLWLAEGWSGYALDMTGTEPRTLITSAMASTNRANFAMSNGTVRLWFAPAWTSTSLGGAGPEQWATLFELGQTNTVTNPLSLALMIDPDGTHMVFLVRTNGSYVPLLRAEIGWFEGEWHQVALVYHTAGVDVMIDDVWAASTAALPPWPGRTVWSASVFSLGGDLAGEKLAQGQLDEVHTFGHALTPEYLAWTYQQFSPIAALGPIADQSSRGLRGGAQLLSLDSLPAPPPCENCSTNDPGPPPPPPVPGFSITNGLRFAPTPYLTNNGTGYVTWLLGTNAGERYEIYQTTNLLGTSLWASAWTRVATGGVSFTLSHSTNDGATAFFRATTYVDADGDGISDAYEYLVMRTTNLWDFDSDGIPDFWEMAHGLNYTNATDALGDVDGDGIKNLAEYQYEAALINPVEPLGPSSRRTPLVISEIMYHPTNGGTEFIEIYNTHHLPIKLDGFTLGIPLDPARFYAFTNTTLAPGTFIAITPTTNILSSTKLQLRNNRGAVLLEVEFSDNAPWPKAPDGTGHSLVLSRPSYGENDVRAWSASARIGGSPGTAEPIIQDFKAAIRINEFLANPIGTNVDYVELYNAGSVTQDISGWFLSNDADSLTNFAIPPGTRLPPRGFVSFLRDAPNSFHFPIPSAGGSLFLTAPDLTRVIDAIGFKAQDLGVSMGRVPDGGAVFRELSSQTRGGTNALPLIRDVVISEIMYHPISGLDSHEYVEVFNRSTNVITTTGWSFDGINFSFPTSSFYLWPTSCVVIAYSTNTLKSMYPGRFTILNPVVGNFAQSTLANGGQRLALKNASGVVMDEVIYKDGGQWGRWSDGGGGSLELINPNSDHRLAANWADSNTTTTSAWTTVTYTGQLMDGDGNPANALEIMLTGPGECLIDDVEVKAVGGNNVVSNGGFENGTTGWIFEGDHDLSTVETNGAYSGTHVLHVRASNQGDYLGNRIQTGLNSSLSVGSTGMISARVRWLCGTPEVVLRLRGNYLEAVGQMPLPLNLGTPGLINSRAVTNAPPVIYDVNHFPIVPAANEPVIVSARASDFNGVTNLVLKYRIDPFTTNANVTMNDGGTNGDAFARDGLFSAIIPGQVAGKLIAFYIEASDLFGATSRFPKQEFKYPGDVLGRECLVLWGDAQPSGSFGTYRIWMTQSNINEWGSQNRVKIHNGALDATFVYGNHRAIYNSGAKYGGSPNRSGGYTGPLGTTCKYDLEFPKDDRFLGASGVWLDVQKDDGTLQAEETANWVADRLGLAFNYRRSVNLYVRGQKRDPIFKDSQRPDSDFFEEWYPDDSDGDLFKLAIWWPCSSVSVSGTAIHATMEKFLRPTAAGDVLNVARYRWNWQKRAVQNSASDYTSLSNLVEAVANPAAANYASNLDQTLDSEQWMRILALRRFAGDADSYGYGQGQNMYMYRSETNRWRLHLFDMEYAFYAAGWIPTDQSLFDVAFPTAPPDPKVTDIIAHPQFRRAFWRAMQDLVNGPFANGDVATVMSGNRAILLANGVTPTKDYTEALAWIADRRAYVIEQLVAVAAPFAITNNNGNDFTNTVSSVTLGGAAPVEAAFIRINSTTSNAPVTWATVTNWTISVSLNNGANPLTVQGYDRLGQTLGGASSSITITKP